MDLSLFPMDIVRCHIVFESYSYNSAKVRLRWNERQPVQIIGKVQLAEFNLFDFSTAKNNFTYPAGNWDQLAVRLFFRRSYGRAEKRTPLRLAAYLSDSFRLLCASIVSAHLRYGVY